MTHDQRPTTIFWPRSCNQDYLTRWSRTLVLDVKLCMRLVFLVVAALLIAGPVAAQSNDTSPPATTASAPADAPQLNLPVSLERIREALLELPPQPRLRGLDRQPDFRVRIEERQRLEELFRALEYKLGPTVPGGLYAYEQQRLLFNKTTHPLQQPYAAYSGGELVTLAIEGIVQRLLAGRVTDAVSGWERSRAEKAAREEVQRSIADFCAAQQDRNEIEICWLGTADR